MKNRLHLKGIVYHIIIRPDLFHGAKCWPVKKCRMQRMSIAKMRFIHWMCGHTSDKNRNKVTGSQIAVASIDDENYTRKA